MSISNMLSQTAQSILLLTSYFSKFSDDGVKPLTNSEWGRFALWLKENFITPADLLITDPKELLRGWQDKYISVERIIMLLNRGHSLALAMEKWQRAGLWVITRSDQEYPKRLKQRLQTISPPVLFGCGNKALLNMGGLAVVGSRNANELDLEFTRNIGEKAAKESIVIISGGARGIDEAAMMGSIKEGGRVIGVLADNLLRAVTSSKWRKGLMNDHIVLISPFYPEVGFNVGNAMARNKYIYCLADSSLVIHSGKKGGTLSGAEENLKKNWVPLWVKSTEDKEAANSDLVAKGGRWLKTDIQSLEVFDLINNSDDNGHQEGELIEDLFTPIQSELFSDDQEFYNFETEFKKDICKTNSYFSSKTDIEQRENEQGLERTINIGSRLLKSIDFYQLFISEIQHLAVEPMTVAELVEIMGLHKSQLNNWLKRAVNDGVVQKFYRPVRYQVKNNK